MVAIDANPLGGAELLKSLANRPWDWAHQRVPVEILTAKHTAEMNRWRKVVVALHGINSLVFPGGARAVVHDRVVVLKRIRIGRKRHVAFNQGGHWIDAARTNLIEDPVAG